jgi:uncharacterized protein YegJ (DUF2314 family)
MSESQLPPVFLFDDSDPEMQRAYAAARAAFRYFWCEVALDRHRIVPALELAGVKAPFSDGKERSGTDDTPEAEHLWLSEVDFDGRSVSGVVLNTPNWLTTVKEGDSVRIPLGRISDWIYAISGEAYGGYTVNLLRSRMSEQERREHDAAWGLNFGDPGKVRMVAEYDHQTLWDNMAASLRNHLKTNPSQVSAKGHNGWTLLHQDASAGSTATVQVLLEAGADPNEVTDNGMTALQLAEVLGWDAVVALLTSGPA